MKSALELALEKTKDIVPQDDPMELSKEAKQQIRDINREFDALIAEIELKVSARLREAESQFSQEEIRQLLPELEAQLQGERDRINAERAEKTEAVRKADLESRQPKS
ncbi:MAG TPA: hypothetical protein PKH33_15120 [bacterium]|nr:hypothetical protein [bacterium]